MVQTQESRERLYKNSPGLNSIEISAEDDGSPSSTTSVTMYINVLDVLPPELTIEGNLAICAGAETTITANGDFDSFSWNLNSQFTNGKRCDNSIWRNVRSNGYS